MPSLPNADRDRRRRSRFLSKASTKEERHDEAHTCTLVVVLLGGLSYVVLLTVQRASGMSCMYARNAASKLLCYFLGGQAERRRRSKKKFGDRCTTDSHFDPRGFVIVVVLVELFVFFSPGGNELLWQGWRPTSKMYR